MSKYKYPHLYAHGTSRRKLAAALGMSPRKLRQKQHPKCKSDFTGEEIRRASDFLNRPASELFSDSSPAYIGILSESGRYVPEECALTYAMERCGIAPMQGREVDSEFAAFLIEWFYSGDWLFERSFKK